MTTARAALATLLVLATAAAGAAERVYATGDGAIRGYDPVAYFTEGRPVKGRSDLTFEWNGATWRFASEATRAAFAKDPERWAPQYGGYCAYAVANGYTAKIEPEAFRVVEGKLYLNYSLGVRERWEADMPGFIRRADANWPGVLD